MKHFGYNVSARQNIFFVNSKSTIHLTVGTFDINNVEDHHIPCKALDANGFHKANKLLDEVANFCDPDHIITCPDSPENRPAPSDSDDDTITDPASLAAFDSKSLQLVQYFQKEVSYAYLDDQVHGFYNAVGKQFTISLCRFAERCLHSTASPFMFTTNGYWVLAAWRIFFSSGRSHLEN